MTDTNTDIEKEMESIKAEAKNYTKIRDERCIPVAREILLRLASLPDLMIGSNGITIESITEYYSAFVGSEVLPLLLEKNILVNDVAYIFKIMAQAIDFAKDRTLMTTNLRYDQATAYKWGVKDVDDEVTICDVQKALVERDEAKASVDNL